MSIYDDPLEILLHCEGHDDEAELLHAQNEADDCRTKPCTSSDNTNSFQPNSTYFF